MKRTKTRPAALGGLSAMASDDGWSAGPPARNSRVETAEAQAREAEAQLRKVREGCWCPKARSVNAFMHHF